MNSERPETMDPRALRTRRAIKDAFEARACEVDIERITVKEIAERAHINRKTFYLHYETIEALFEEVLNEILDSFFEEYEITPETPEDIAGHAVRFFRFLASQPKLTERLVCGEGRYRFGEKLYKMQMQRYKESGDPFEWLGQDKEELVKGFIRTTALDFFCEWAKAGRAVPVDDAADLLAHLTCYGVSGLMKDDDGNTLEMTRHASRVLG